jgi:ABC-type phosphate/phosphonate transport system substrate-binding protein
MRALSFLGAAARPHYAAVATIVARTLGLPAPAVEEPGLDNLDAAVADPQPALVFLCGLPYVRLRDRGAPVEPLVAPVPDEPGTPEAAVYFSDLVARPGAPPLARCRVGFNNDDSLSGWVLPRSELEQPDALRWVRTGTHRRSLQLLEVGEIDAAPIDSYVLRLERLERPAYRAFELRQRIGPMPAPPVVAFGGDPALHRAMRAALLDLPRTAEGRRALRLGAVLRYAPVTSSTYEPVRALDRAAAASAAAAPRH